MDFRLLTADKKFAPFFWTQFWGSFNDNFFKNALAVIVAFRGVQLLGLEPGALIAVATGLIILPFFIFSPIAGQIADKYEKSVIIRWTKRLEIFIMFFAALGFFFQSYLLLLGLLFLMGTQSAFFGPLKYSIIPELVSEENLIEGNAFIELGTFLSVLLGTIAGGFLTSMNGADLWIGIGLLLFAVLGYVSALRVPQVKVGDPNLKLQWNPFPEFVNLWKIMKQKVAIFNSILAISWFWFYGAGILSVLPIYVKDYLMGNENIATLFLAMFTLGVGVGSILCVKLSHHRVEIGIVPLGSLGLTLFILDLYWVGAPWVDVPHGAVSLTIFTSVFSGWRLMFDFFMMSVCGGIFIVPLYTLLQERADPKTRSRVIAGNNVMNAIFMVASSVLLIQFYSWKLSPVEIFAIFGVMNLVVAFYIYRVVPEFTLRFYSWVLSRIVYSIKVKGYENVPPEGAFILAPNHVSFVDWLILSGACKVPVSYVMYYKFFTIPFVRHLMKQSKVIPIAGKKENPEIMNNAFERVSQNLRDQQPVCIFPEGTITHDGRLNPFRPGLLKILEKDPVPVIPVVIHGLYGSIFSRAPKKDRIRRRNLVVEFLPAIAPVAVVMENLESLIAGSLGQTPPHQKKKGEDNSSPFDD